MKQDPEFARALKENGTERSLAAVVPSLPPNTEAKAFTRTKRVLHQFNWLLYLASLFSALAFGRIISDTSWDVSPRNFVITAAIAACFWIAFFARGIWVQRRVYRTTMKPDA
jgi:hypothetical protein